MTTEAIKSLVLEHLGHAYWCNRDWSAWSVGTMDSDDFTPLEADESPAVDELAEALSAALKLTPATPVVAAAWNTIGTAFSEARNYPPQDEKVLLELRSGAFAVGQLTWAYRWLLQGGGVLLLQDVVRWQRITPHDAHVPAPRSAPHHIPCGQCGACAAHEPCSVLH